MSDIDALSELVDHLALDSPAVDAVASDPLASKTVDHGRKVEQQLELQNEIDGILKEISSRFSAIYELEERRHAGPFSSGVSGAKRTDELLASLNSSIQSIKRRVEGVTSAAQPLLRENRTLQADLGELQDEWDRLDAAYVILKEEQKEDGWLSRFRTTAEQAEAMMDPLQKSLADCSSFLDGLQQNGPTARQGLQELAKSHESMKATYVPSVTKILKMVNKSVTERPTQNGEALRRLGEMQSRWSTLSKQLQKLDDRLRSALDQRKGSSSSSLGDIEVLTDPTSSIPSPTDDHFGVSSSRPTSHHSSGSSNHSAMQAKPSLYSLNSKSPAEGTRTVRRQPSNISTGTVGDKPKWDIGTKPPPVPAVPPMYQTSSSRRLSTYGVRPPVPRSPTPSSSSVTSGSRISVPGSRIPVRSPPPSQTRSEMVIPSQSRGEQGNSRQSLDPHSYLTPTRPRQSAPFSLPRSTTPSYASRSASYGATLAPNAGSRSEPPRRNLARNPPSSFRSTTPTPSRPSSRLSASSFIVSAAALHPFEPSRFDLLDQEVSKILEQVGFNLFVARLDPALKRGQRKRDDEEWKGEFVFGAGERSSSVKLLKLVGRAMDGGQVRMKCMCRVAGAWRELSAVLQERLAKASAQVSSP